MQATGAPHEKQSSESFGVDLTLQLSVNDAVMHHPHCNCCMIDKKYSIDSELQDTGAVRKCEQIQSENGVVDSFEVIVG